jgi:hypothetical protein
MWHALQGFGRALIELASLRQDEGDNLKSTPHNAALMARALAKLPRSLRSLAMTGFNVIP